MKIHVYLDDYRACPKGFVLAKNVEECIQLIDECEIDILSLDFDLGWGEPTGIEVVRHLVHKGKYPQQIFLHTSSFAGRLQMYELLSANLPASTRLVGSEMPHELLAQIATKRKS